MKTFFEKQQKTAFVFQFSDCSGPLELLDNGVCNDEVNNPECSFDGGDCCGDCINTELCSTCLCHAEAEPAMDLSCKHC